MPSVDSHPIVAPELEFFLAERDPDATNGLRRYVDELSRVYTVGAVSDPREIVLRMLLWCDELGLQAFAANHEFMNSQYEINVKHSGALDAADRAFMLKAAVKEIAVREGMLATFMGRPFADQGGSGFHVHLSLNDANGKNAFADEGGPDGLSPLAANFIAGVIDHAQGLQAILGPTINSYKRILPDSLAPTHANWGHDNRTAFCRVPNERGSRARVEVRTADGAACAHLMIAALLLAGLDGIERGLAPPDPVVGMPIAWTMPTPALHFPPISGRPRCPRGRHGAHREDRLDAHLDLRRDEAIRGRAVHRGRRRARRRGRQPVGDRGICCPSLAPRDAASASRSTANAVGTPRRPGDHPLRRPPDPRGVGGLSRPRAPVQDHRRPPHVREPRARVRGERRHPSPRTS